MISSDKVPYIDLPPWVAGPSELLSYGLKLLREDTDSSRRLSMIIIDNSVELLFKTFLSLPKRINKLKITRKEVQEISESFPLLLDAMEKYAPDKISGIDLGEIEWYHRLRNLLYHQGNGITIEREKVLVYSILANELFNKLFGVKLIQPEEDKTQLFAKFLELWTKLEEELYSVAFDHSATGIPEKKGVNYYANYLSGGDLISKNLLKEIKYYQNIRNTLVHDYKGNEYLLSNDLIKSFQTVVEKFTKDI